MAAGLGRSIPLACQDWAATKAAYGFFSNERICEEQILAGHFQATRERLPQGEEPVLVLHDTTEFTYQREDEAAVGLLSKGSVRKDKQGQPVTVIEAREQQIPPDRDRIDWKLVTDLQVGSLDAAHREGEQARLRTTARLTNLPAVFCIHAWRVFWLTMTNRIAPDAQPELVFTKLELRVLDQLVNDKSAPQSRPQPALSPYLIKLARLGGYLARNSDPPPGNETIWRGLTRLIDIQLGVMLGAQLVGN